MISEVGEPKVLNPDSDSFNMLEPNQDFKIDSDYGTLTFGALEQIVAELNNIFDYF